MCETYKWNDGRTFRGSFYHKTSQVMTATYIYTVKGRPTSFRLYEILKTNVHKCKLYVQNSNKKNDMYTIRLYIYKIKRELCMKIFITSVFI